MIVIFVATLLEYSSTEQSIKKNSGITAFKIDITTEGR